MFRRYLPAMVENLATDRHDSLPGKLPRDTAQRLNSAAAGHWATEANRNGIPPSAGVIWFGVLIVSAAASR